MWESSRQVFAEPKVRRRARASSWGGVWRKPNPKTRDDEQSTGYEVWYIRGMRITVKLILRALSADVSEQNLVEKYPELEREDFHAVFAYATKLVEE
jgi:hypothetical protein